LNVELTLSFAQNLQHCHADAAIFQRPTTGILTILHADRFLGALGPYAFFATK
jgi:hypothetical protein